MNLGCNLRSGFVIGLIGALCLLVLLPPVTLAAQAPLPPRPTPTFPWSVAAQSESTAGSIVLKLMAGTDAAALDWASLWTVVEWQDDKGQWNTVEGWQGAFDEVVAGVGQKSWGVADDVLGKGPFRWVVYLQKGGTPLAVSGNFNLPASSSETVVVSISLGAEAAPALLPVSGSEWSGTPWLMAAGLLMVGCGMAMACRKRVL